MRWCIQEVLDQAREEKRCDRATSQQPRCEIDAKARECHTDGRASRIRCCLLRGSGGSDAHSTSLQISHTALVQTKPCYFRFHAYSTSSTIGASCASSYTNSTSPRFSLEYSARHNSQLVRARAVHGTDLAINTTSGASSFALTCTGTVSCTCAYTYSRTRICTSASSSSCTGASTSPNTTSYTSWPIYEDDRSRDPNVGFSSCDRQ